MNQNLLVMLADLFNVLEIHPAKCVRFPGGHCELEGNVTIQLQMHEVT